MTGRTPSALSEVIRWSGTAETILRQHGPDLSGRCPVCHADGSSSGRVKAPCNLWAAAAQARRTELALGARAATPT